MAAIESVGESVGCIETRVELRIEQPQETWQCCGVTFVLGLPVGDNVVGLPVVGLTEGEAVGYNDRKKLRYGDKKRPDNADNLRKWSDALDCR